MKNLTKEQIERINEVFDSLYGDEFSKEEMEDFESIEDKREAIEQYYEAVGFDIGESEENFWRFLGM